jgi:hypothetical protein
LDGRFFIQGGRRGRMDEVPHSEGKYEQACSKDRFFSGNMIFQFRDKNAPFSLSEKGAE